MKFVKMKKEVIRISNIEIAPVPPYDGLIGFASFLINNCFFVGNVAIFTSPSSPDGFRLVYPTKMGVSCFHPLNREVGDMIRKQVIARYLELMEKLTKGEEIRGKREGSG